MIHSITFEVGGKEFSIESGRVAKQANAAVLLGMGETVVLGTATVSNEPRQGLDFFPLLCDYEERKYSVGKIPGGFIKRGGRPSEKATLTSRLIDRPVRPLFPKGMRNDVHCVAMTFAVDQEFPPDVLGINAVSAALTISDIPWNGPIGAVRIGMVDDELILFPSVEQAENGQLDLIVAGTAENILMVEAGASEVSDERMIKAMDLAHEMIKQICAKLIEFRQQAGKEKREFPIAKVDPDVMGRVRTESGQKVRDTIVNPDKAARESALSDLKKEIVAHHIENSYPEDEDKQAQLGEAVDKLIEETVRNLIIEEGRRPDGRGTTDIRNLSIEPGLLPKVHGSGLFARGQTQVMTVVTLGSPSQGQTLDGIEDVENKRYMHFYNFPPYSVGECRPMRGPGRREIGHGALAERALKAVIPTVDDFPYSYLLTSEVLESNGSSSMASVCGSTIALLDCGVPIKAPVAGIAMGLVTDGPKYKILTDIQGMEDFCGDMDFKVAGTRDGITALQLDCKIQGLTRAVMVEAISQARDARMVILDAIDEAIPERRADLNPNAPRIEILKIDPARIGELIGPGGKNIKKIVAESGAQVDVNDEGHVFVCTSDSAAMEVAKRMVQGLVMTPELGMEFEGPVTRMFSRGVMVEFLPGREGMVPIEQLTPKVIRRPEDVVQPGDVIRVQIHEIDSLGRTNLTAIGLPQTLPTLEENEAATPPVPQPREPRGDRDRRGGGRDRDRGPRDRGPRDRDRGGRGDRYESRDRGGTRGREDSRPPRQEKTYEEPEFKPSGEGGFPRRDDESESNVGARFRPKR